MSGRLPATKPFNIRLPLWAVDYIERRSAEQGITKTQLVLDALSALRAAELRGLMSEGYEEMRAANSQLADRSIAIAGEGLPEWKASPPGAQRPSHE